MSPTSTQERRAKATQLKARIKSLTAPIPYLSHSRFNELRQRGAPLVIIDAREPEEVSVSTIPSAIPMSLANEHLRHMEQAHGTDFQVVCYCTVGFRSGLYAKSLETAATNVYNYSLMEHLWADGTLVSDMQRQTRAHVYSKHYESYFPDRYRYEAFGAFTALYRGLAHLPSLFSITSSENTHQEEEPIGS
ncbi:unnamed protein product [Agarophyton chilense]